MEINVVDEDAQHGQPLLEDQNRSSAPANQNQKNIVQKAIDQTFKSTAHLANLLPTGTVLAFQLLSPIFTNQGQCDNVCQYMTAGLIAICGLSCFVLSFTDSFRDKSGNVCYGLATLKGLWVLNGEDASILTPEVVAGYRLKFIDFIHAFMSILLFAAVALLDQNVVSCFYPNPSRETEEMLTSLPIGIGVICSMMFVTFPTRRHGIGFPISSS
ncbi:protein DMP6 [Magnolia sinica]|uniref:protein DMP6 n=1 Tax=Magnolia sinica TaxID=86752 RepID=UPI00265AFB16|nr:protein DMP6 [Magnolia sinica]